MDLTAGNSFNNAREASSGQTYRATIVSGEVQYVLTMITTGQSEPGPVRRAVRVRAGDQAPGRRHRSRDVSRNSELR